MRGRTLSEASSPRRGADSTAEQKKRLLTRQGSTQDGMNGDITQIDLPNGRRSGFWTPSTY